MAAGLHPGILTTRGLGPATDALAARSGLPVKIVVPDDMTESGPVLRAR
jgi:hypothetical protein